MKLKLSLNSKEAKVLSNEDMFESLLRLESFQDAAEAGECDTEIATHDTLAAIKNVRDTHNPNFLKIVAEQPEFYGISLEDIGAQIDKLAKEQCISPAQEGHFQDFLHDGIIGMIIHWDDHTVEELRGLIPTMRSRIKAADEDIFGKWKLFFQIGVYSKYLPDFKDVDKAVACLQNCFKYLKSVKPEKFDSTKYVKFYEGTCYNKNSWTKEYMKKALIAKSAEILSSIASAFIPFAGLVGVYFTWESDIRKRGWTGRRSFLIALDKAEALVKEMESLSDTVEKYKGKQFNDDDYVTAKAYFKACEQTIKLAGYFGRGIVAASRSIGGSVWRRLFTLDR